MKISSLAEKIEEAVQEGNIEFGEYDLIISATGDHNVNRWINQYVMSNKLMVPVVYAWNEVLGWEIMWHILNMGMSDAMSVL